MTSHKTVGINFNRCLLWFIKSPVQNTNGISAYVSRSEIINSSTRNP